MPQKIVIINSSFLLSQEEIKQEQNTGVREFPELDAYFDDDWEVRSVTPVVSSQQDNFGGAQFLILLTKM